MIENGNLDQFEGMFRVVNHLMETWKGSNSEPVAHPDDDRTEHNIAQAKWCKAHDAHENKVIEDLGIFKMLAEAGLKHCDIMMNDVCHYIIETELD